MSEKSENIKDNTDDDKIKFLFVTVNKEWQKEKIMTEYKEAYKFKCC